MAGNFCSTLERKLGAIAELTLTEGGAVALQERLLDWFQGELGYDLAAFQTNTHGHVTMQSRGYDNTSSLQKANAYMSEFEPHELAAASCGRAIIDTEVLSARRRDRLALYREQLRPLRVTEMLTTAWPTEDGGAGVYFARTGRPGRFKASEVALLNQLVPMIRLAQAYARKLDKEKLAHADDFLDWGHHYGLSAGELRVASLVVRGLTNREVAQLLGISAITVRNQLAAVFRKTNVSTRAELAYFSRSERRFPSAQRPSEKTWVRYLGREEFLAVMR